MKTSRLVIQDNAQTYINYIKHSINSSKSIIFILNKNYNKEFFLSVATFAITANCRMHFLASEDLNFSEVVTYLKSQDLATYKLCAFSWEADGLKVTKKEDELVVDPPVKYADAIFHIPVSQGKWYYEVTLTTSGYCNQIGWANELMDTSIQVSNFDFHYHI